MGARRTDLRVDFCGLRLANPLVLASGGLGERAETLAPFLDAGAAAVVTRTVRLRVDSERRVFPSPHLGIGPHGGWMLNCEWGNLRPWHYWQREGLPGLRSRGTVIVSISGRDRDGCIALARELDAQAALFEVNVSCSHAGQLYGRITDDPEHVARLVRGLKAAVTTPVMVKLGWSPFLTEVAQAAAAAGADAIATTNSIGPGLDLDLDSGRPRLGIEGGSGGMSGRAIFPIALECVHRVVEAVDLPVMGVGGIASYREVVKMLMVGASCVQLYTEPFLRGPRLFQRLIADLETWLAAHGHGSLDTLRGSSRPHLRGASHLDPVVPEVDQERCKPCGLCQRVCTVDAIEVGQVASVDPWRCIGCGACVDACPPALGAMRLPNAGS